ncbi:MAG: TonB-dependent receptor [Bacteroidetes bacterium]|nr:TonB-dependent receptor [Bacteroidota bacterium]
MPLCVLSQISTTNSESIETGQFKKVKHYELADVTRVINENEIKLRGANNLKDLLIMETGAIFKYDKIKGWNFLWHGSAKNNIMVLIDGLPFRTYFFDENDPQQIPLDNVLRIEIIENPQGVAYGSNAITCVINLIFKTAQHKVYKPSLKLQGYYPGSFYSNVSIGRKTTENFFRYSGSIDAFSGINGTDSGRVLHWLPYTRVNNQLVFSHKVLQYMDATVGFNNLIEQKTQLGYPLPASFTAYDREIKYNVNTVFASLKGRLTRYYNLQADMQFFKYRRFNTLYLKDIVTSTQTEVNDTSLNDTIKYSGFFSRIVLSKNNKNNDFNYLAGFDVTTVADSYNPIVNKVYQKNSNTALFAIASYKPINRLILYFGLRLPYNTKFKSKPLLDLKLNLKFNENFRLKAMIARSSKSPDFDQIFATYLTNGFSIKRNLNLMEEDIISYHYSFFIKTKYFTAEPGFFSYNFKNGIELLTDPYNPGRLVYRNVSEKKIIGSRLNFMLQSKYADVNLRIIYTGNNHLANLYNGMFFFQETYINVIFKIPLYNLNFCYTGKSISKYGYMAIDNQKGDLAHFIGKYYLADAVFEKSFNKKTISLKAGFRNIFNVKNINAYSQPIEYTGKEDKTNYIIAMLPGRTVFFELNINL